MNTKPLVSIITPCYNMERVVTRLFDSVISQTYRPIEFILVDDGSTDSSYQIAENYRSKFADADIDYVLIHQENKGLAGAINTGLRNLHGEYFCWPDADDYLEPASVEERVAAFREHPECGVVTSNAYVRKSSDLNTVVSTLGSKPEFYEAKQFLHHLNGCSSIFCSGCHMANTEKFRAVVPDMQIYPARRGQNWQLLLPLYYAYDRFFLNKPLYNYIDYPNSMSKGSNTYESLLFRYAEHETLLKETLSQIEDVQGVDMHAYYSFIENKYAKLRMEAAIMFRNKRAFNNEYAKKQRLVGIDDYDKLALIRSTSPCVDKLLCFCWRIAKNDLRALPEKIVNKMHFETTMLNNNTVSILIPCYNAEDYIQTCINCLLYQSYKNLEIILVNDGSTDRSEKVIMENIPSFEKQGIKFIYVKQNNAGAAAAVDTALQYVTGQYIMLYDVDDILYRDAVYEKVKYLDEHPEYNMVVNNGYYVKSPEELGKNFFYYDAPDTSCFFNGLIDGKYHNWPGSYMIRTKEFRKRLPKSGHIYTSQYGQNLQFMMPMAYKSKVGYIEKPLMSYYVRPDSHSHYGGTERCVERSIGYANNRIEILKSMDMPKQEREHYISQVKGLLLKGKQKITNNDHSRIKNMFHLFTRIYDKCARVIRGNMLERKLRSELYG